MEQPQPLPEREKSLVHDFESEWRKRPVNVMKIFKSLYTQLTEGADLTRISMPSEICHPFSVLEVIGHRELANFNTLLTLCDHPTDPLERFLCVVRWIISCFPQEHIEKKPFNPTIGEEHICWIENDEDDWTELIAEQVSHHPPLSAFFMRNKKKGVSISSTMDFSVSFGANYVTITSGGHVTINTPFEAYTMNKLVPNLVIQRIIFGVKYYMWDGSLSLECPTTGYKLNISFSEKNETTNKIKGDISLNGQPVINISGAAGKVVHYWKTDDKKKKKELYNFSTAPKKNENVSYPPVDCRVEMNSLRMWKDVSDAVIRDDMFAADNAKKKVEHEQRIRERKREQEGAEYKAVYFDQVLVNQKLQWVPKEGIEISKTSLEGLKEVVAKQKVLAQERALANPQPEPEVLSPESQKLKTEKSSKCSLAKSPSTSVKDKKNKGSDHKQSLSPDQGEVDVGSPKEGQDPENCLIS